MYEFTDAMVIWAQYSNGTRIAKVSVPVSPTYYQASRQKIIYAVQFLVELSCPAGSTKVLRPGRIETDNYLLSPRTTYVVLQSDSLEWFRILPDQQFTVFDMNIQSTRQEFGGSRSIKTNLIALEPKVRQYRLRKNSLDKQLTMCLDKQSVLDASGATVGHVHFVGHHVYMIKWTSRNPPLLLVLGHYTPVHSFAESFDTDWSFMDFTAST